MHSIDEARARLASLDRSAGSAARDLSVGTDTIRFEGLSDAFAATLDARWGGFLGPARAAAPRIVVRAVRGDGSSWLPRWRPGESYRPALTPQFERAEDQILHTPPSDRR